LKEKEEYNILIHKADTGILLSKNNPKYLSKFFFYKGYAYEFTDNQYEKATYYFEKSLRLAQYTKSVRQQALALMRLNYMYYSLKENQKGERLINYVKKILDTVRDRNSKAMLLGSLGEYYLDRSEYENFINSKTKAIDLLLKDENKDDLKRNNIGVSYLQIADAYNDMKQYDKAVEYCNYAKPYLNKSDSVAFLYNTFIEAYINLGKIDLAEDYYRELFEVAKNNKMLFINISYGNRNLSEYYLENDELKLAENHADKALFFAKESNDEEIEMEANVIKGKVLFQKKKYDEAIKILSKTLSLADIYDKRSLAEINKKLSESYAAKKQWEKAYHFFDAFNQTNDSLLLESGKQSLANAEAKFQNKGKQQEIKSLTTTNTIHELRIKNDRKQRIYLISGLVFIAVIGGMLYYQSRNRKRNNGKLLLLNSELDKANKTKMQFFGILNHDLRSPVVSLVNFLHLQKEAPELMDKETEDRLRRQTTRSAEKLLEQMEGLLLWSKGQMENFEPKNENVPISQIFAEIENEFSWIENIDLKFNYPNDMKLFTDKEFLKTIIRNLVGNSMKVLQGKPNALIVCKAWETNDSSYISILDNGGGVSLEKFRALYDYSVSVGIKQGFGLHVIRDLCKAISCKIEVESNVKIGETNIILSLEKI
jgi:pentatricopeptide repeat protein